MAEGDDEAKEHLARDLLRAIEAQVLLTTRTAGQLPALQSMMPRLRAMLEERSRSAQDVAGMPVPEDATQTPDGAAGHATVSGDALLQFAEQYEGLAAALDELAGAVKASASRSLQLGRALRARLVADQQRDDEASGAVRAQPTATLVSLPEELLACVVQLAGTDARPVCRRLRAAYGPPRAVLKEPRRRGEPACTSHAQAGPMCGVCNTMFQYHTKYDVLTELLDGLHVRMPSAAVASCVARWPGQFTALELSSTHLFHWDSLQELHSLLPDLQQLKCPWLGSDEDIFPRQHLPRFTLPRFTGLTSLWLSCSLADVVLDCPHLHMHREVHRMLCIAPQLQSLVADLRFRSLVGFPAALGQAQHLTSLTVMFDERVQDSFPDELLRATAALQAVAPRLRALELWSLRKELGAALGHVVEGMTRLTRLGWVLQEGRDGFDRNSRLPRWGRLEQLQQLTLGNNSSGRWSALPEVCFGPLQAAFRSCPCESLQALSLPVYEDCIEGERRGQVRALVEAVQEGCPNLTSLVLGGPSYGEDLELPPLPQWLAPAGGMLHLRRLAVMMDIADIGQLACLAPLPALEWLWLQLQDRWCSRISPAQVFGEEPPPGQALARVTSLRHLTLLQPAGESKMYHSVCLEGQLLAAAACLPQLQVLDAYVCRMPDEAEQYWQQLADRPPATLRRVLLRAPMRESALWGDADAGLGVRQDAEALGGNCIELARLKQLLKSRLPEAVEVALAYSSHLEEVADEVLSIDCEYMPKPFAPFPGVCC